MKTWIDTVQNTYRDINDLERWDFNWGVCARCGFDSPEEMWNKNPIIGGSVLPEDFGEATMEDVAKALIPEYHEAISFTENFEAFDFSEEAEDRNFEDLFKFVLEVGWDNIRDIIQFVGGNKFISLFAHDFWLSRNGHGSGFFDEDCFGDYQDMLQVKSALMGERYAEVDDDNYLIYIQ
jgi:hypothetical protein